MATYHEYNWNFGMYFNLHARQDFIFFLMLSSNVLFFKN